MLRYTVALIAIVLIGAAGFRILYGTARQTDANSLFESCPSAADVASINKDLKLSFESDPTKGTLTCTAAAGSANLTLMQSRVYRSLLAMRQLSFDAPLPWTKDQVYAWMVKTIKGIRFRADIQNSFCCEPADTIDIRAVVQGTPPSGLGIAIPDYPGSRMPTDFRMLESFMGLIVHEARHRNGMPHTCGTKDTSINQLGAWGAQYYFHTWVADHTAPGFLTPAVRDAVRSLADGVCSGQFCEDRCKDRVEDLEYVVLSAAVTTALELPGTVRMVVVSDRTIGFPCETGTESGLIVGDCNGMRTAKQTPEQALAAIRKSMPVVTKEMVASFILGAGKSYRMEKQLNMPVRQVLWGPASGTPMPQTPLPPDYTVYPSRVGFNPSRDAALLYLGVKALSSQARSFGEYMFLTRTGVRWEVKGRARVWETNP